MILVNENALGWKNATLRINSDNKLNQIKIRGIKALWDPRITMALK